MWNRALDTVTVSLTPLTLKLHHARATAGPLLSWRKLLTHIQTIIFLPLPEVWSMWWLSSYPHGKNRYFKEKELNIWKYQTVRSTLILCLWMVLSIKWTARRRKIKTKESYLHCFTYRTIGLKVYHEEHIRCIYLQLKYVGYATGVMATAWVCNRF